MKLVKRIVRRKVRELQPVIVEKAVDAVAGRAVQRAENSGVLGFVQRLTPGRLKALAIASVGAIVALNVLGNFVREQKLKLMFRRELKKQLRPLEKKIDDLEDENEQLRRQLKAR